MANLLDNCPSCFEITLNECADFIVIEGGFIVFEDYVIIITDKFGHEYRLNLTAGYDGELTIDVTDLPDGLFTAYSGVFTVKIYESDGCTPATITICEDVYTCLKLTFKTVLLETDDDIIEYIKCCEEELTSVEILSWELTEDGLLSFSVDFDNAYSYDSNRPVIEYSNDGISFTSNTFPSAYTFPEIPFTGNEPSLISTVSPTVGFYYRFGVKNIDGDVIYSNIIQYT